ncbi:MAG: TonB-dependent receptor, partial [Balneolaceae bacterium]|nr:TonB-dependent receptor [Balneolaceae bacterium]
VSKYIANHPAHQVSLGLRYQTGRFSIHSQSGYYVRSAESAEIIDAEVPSEYFLTNLNVSYSPQRLGATFYTQILNLTDTQYQEILGAPMPGRWVMGGVRFRLR